MISVKPYDPNSLLLAMKDGLLLIDENDQILFSNQAAQLLLKISENITDCHKLIPSVIFELSTSLSPLKRESEGELAIVVDGETKYFQVKAQLVQNEESEDVSLRQSNYQKMVLVVLHDVTRLHRLENLRRDFVANVSHELKTPITSIKAAAETLQDGAVFDSESMPRFLDIIARQSDRLNNIIEDLLSLSRLENESDEVYLIQGSINEVISDAIASCEIKAKQKSIQIIQQVPNDLCAKMNSTLLEQAVMNLIDNAVKYSDPGTTIEVIVQKLKTEIEISVSDRGRGIEPEHLSRIFERFYRVDRARSRNAGGSGLGLSIVKHIAQVHRGRATVVSQPEHGSTFSLFIGN